MKGDFENVGEMEDTPTETYQSLQQARERGIDLNSFDDDLNGHEDDGGSSVDLDSGQEPASTG